VTIDELIANKESEKMEAFQRRFSRRPTCWVCGGDVEQVRDGNRLTITCIQCGEFATLWDRAGEVTA
jgi:hypothetical protein